MQREGCDIIIRKTPILSLSTYHFVGNSNNYQKSNNKSFKIVFSTATIHIEKQFQFCEYLYLHLYKELTEKKSQMKIFHGILT